MVESIQFGTKKIEFDLSYSDRKSLGITVTPDFEIFVKAPKEAHIDKILEKVRKRAPWIIKQKYFFLSFHPKSAPKNYLAGETHLYLGRQYILKTEISETESVTLANKFITVTTPDLARVKYLLDNWYLEIAKKKFKNMAKPLIGNFKKYDVQPSEIVLRYMPTRWGSCTPKGKIILNPELLKAPKGCIDYVIIHELCHLVHKDHNQKFIDLQTKEMPSWEKWKGRLEKLLA
jgi:predicted metal-dependent hydrolase